MSAPKQPSRDSYDQSERRAVEAIRTGNPSSANFEYSTRLTEIMLVGNAANLVQGEKLAYDFGTGKFTNSEKANALAKREQRKGWEFGYA